MLLFDRSNLPDGIKPETIDIINAALKRLHARKIPSIKFESTTLREWSNIWARVYLQAHIRRSLSFIEGGLAEIGAGRPVIAALCARAIMEDAAAIWDFVVNLGELFAAGDEDAIENFIFSRTLATKLPGRLREHGQQFAAVNVLTLIDRLSKLNPTYRLAYDDLSEVVHPNSLGVFEHFANLDEENKQIVFDDGDSMSDIALGSLIEAAHMLVADEGAILELEKEIAQRV